MIKAVLVISMFCQSGLGAHFVFTHMTPVNPDRPEFVFEITDPKLIKEAQDIIATGTVTMIVTGKIIKRKAPYNPRWSFHLGLFYRN